MSDVYTTTMTATGGRAGRVVSADGDLDLMLVRPVAMGGSEDSSGTNPEQLFAAGYAGCFHASLQFAASTRNITNAALGVEVEVGLQKAPGGGFRLRARIEADMGELDDATAIELLELAHQLCPYSRATRGNIEVEIAATTGDGLITVT